MGFSPWCIFRIYVFKPRLSSTTKHSPERSFEYADKWFNSGFDHRRITPQVNRKSSRFVDIVDGKPSIAASLAYYSYPDTCFSFRSEFTLYFSFSLTTSWLFSPRRH